jgi:translation initiation factor IF-1
VKAKPTKKRSSRRRSNTGSEQKDDKIYFKGVIIEALPGVKFKVKVERDKGLDPLIIDCQTKTLFKVRRIKILKGDSVTVEVDPMEDLTKGVIISRD